MLIYLSCMRVVSRSVATLCDPLDCSLPGASVHGILQARILKWVAVLSSRGSFQPRDGTCVSCIGRQILYHWATWEACITHAYAHIHRRIYIYVCIYTHTYMYVYYINNIDIFTKIVFLYTFGPFLLLFFSI